MAIKVKVVTEQISKSSKNGKRKFKQAEAKYRRYCPICRRMTPFKDYKCEICEF